MNLNMEGKLALVTGGGQGIGEAIVLALAREGADVVINDIESNVENAKRVAGEVHSLGRKAIPLMADVAKMKEVENMVNEVLKEYARIDI